MATAKSDYEVGEVLVSGGCTQYWGRGRIYGNIYGTTCFLLTKFNSRKRRGILLALL